MGHQPILWHQNCFMGLLPWLILGHQPILWHENSSMSLLPWLIIGPSTHFMTSKQFYESVTLTHCWAIKPFSDIKIVLWVCYLNSLLGHQAILWHQNSFVILLPRIIVGPSTYLVNQLLCCEVETFLAIPRKLSK